METDALIAAYYDALMGEALLDLQSAQRKASRAQDLAFRLRALAVGGTVSAVVSQDADARAEDLEAEAAQAEQKSRTLLAKKNLALALPEAQRSFSLGEG